MYNDTIQPFILTQANSISYKTKVFLGLLAVALSLNFSPRQVSAEIYGQYVSSQTCTECHTEISQLWSKTPHAKAYDSLLSSGQQDLPACLQCHVVGYGETGGYLDQELTLELAGVQCESCHGPGKRHINTLDETHNIIRSPTEKDCRNCHTVGQDPHFDFQNKVTLVHNKETTGDSEKQVEPSPSRVNSTLSTDKTTHELGRIQEGKPAIVYTRVLNAGEETIHITDVISSWACTRGVLGKHRLSPKEDTVLKIVYDTDGRPGPFEKRIYLITDSLVQPRLDITLKGEVLPAPAARIRMKPRKIHIGSFQEGSQNKIGFKIINEGNQSLEISNVYSATGKCIVVREGVKIYIPPEESIGLEITLKSNTIGPFVEVLLIDSNAINAFNGQYAVMVIGDTTDP